MRIMSVIASVLVLVAVFVATKSLTAFGYGFWEIVEILVPMAVAVTLFFAGLTYLSLWFVRRLNRSSADRPQRRGGKRGDAEG